MDNPVIINNIISAAKEIGQDNSLKIAVLIITAALTLISNLILKFVDSLTQSRKIKYEKKTFYFNKTCSLVDQTLELIFKMFYNKIMIAYKQEPISTWKNNIFLLHKDILHAEFLLSVYAPLEIFLAFADMRQCVFELEDEKAVARWNEVYDRICKNLEIVRKGLGVVFDMSYEKFMQDIRTSVPREDLGASKEEEFKSQMTTRK